MSRVGIEKFVPAPSLYRYAQHWFSGWQVQKPRLTDSSHLNNRQEVRMRRPSAAWLLPFYTALLMTCDPDPSRAQSQVDLALVLAVDVSSSMTAAEQDVQRQGFVAAFQSPKVHKAIQKGPLGRIAIIYLEWSGKYDQVVLVPWTILDGPATAWSFAERLSQQPTRRGGLTSISGVIATSMRLLDELDEEAMRKVIDISGDGPNNDGRKVARARDRAVAAGITINGLPIMIKSPTSAWDIADLDVYFRDCVVGGVGAFMVAVQHRDQFSEVIRTKLIREISGGEGRRSLTIPAQAGVDCLAGEKRRAEEEALGGEGGL
jgi:hypothetical protein